MDELILEWLDYKYFPYERDLAIREVRSLLKPDSIHEVPGGLRVLYPKQAEHVSRLVYFAQSKDGEKVTSTRQHLLEQSCPTSGSKRRQATRYSVHGIHEYRGKFNPQLSKAIQNILGLEIGTRILDPFCGSGTTLVEGAYSGHPTIGMDMNPLAVKISNAKLSALKVPASQLQSTWQVLQERQRSCESQTLETDARTAYLSKWFPPNTLLALEEYKRRLSDLPRPLSSIFLILLSDLLRDYSLQEPADLRIRRRTSPLPKLPLHVALDQRVLNFIESLGAAQEVAQPQANCSAHLWDNTLPDPEFASRRSFDAAITSPPYSTALPYIDTQRLSLVWLGLTHPQDIRQLEGDVTGSRELLTSELRTWTDRLEQNSSKLPTPVHSYCLNLLNSLSETDGFRRKAVPALLYRYLSSMQMMFQSVQDLLKPSAPFSLVVGHNKTTLGGQRFDIDTPSLLEQVASGVGYYHEESIPLQTYQRYAIHAENSVNTETLLILRTPR